MSKGKGESMDETKYAALKKYFGSDKYAVTEYANGKRGIWQFQLLVKQGRSPMVALSEEFIDDLSVDQIVAKLTAWNVVEQALAHPDMLVMVRHDGISLEARGA